MTTITVVCDKCGQQVDGLIDTSTTPNGEAFLMTGGFYIYDFGVSCDECVHGNSGPEKQSKTPISDQNGNELRCVVCERSVLIIKNDFKHYAACECENIEPMRVEQLPFMHPSEWHYVENRSVTK